LALSIETFLWLVVVQDVVILILQSVAHVVETVIIGAILRKGDFRVKD